MTKVKAHDNELLVEFEFLVDLDLGLFKFIQNNYSTSPYVDPKIIRMRNEYKILQMLIDRKHINPLEIIMPSVETTKLYKQIYEEHEKDLIDLAIPHDTFPLMITFLDNASSIGITVWCKNKAEQEYIKTKAPRLNTILTPVRSRINIDDYDAIYMKYFINATEYNRLSGKHIYIADAGYNFDEEQKTIIGIPSVLYGDTNIIKLIDLYTRVKHTRETEEYDDDLL